MKLLVLGAGYIGARLADLALERGEEVVLADNWYATDRSELAAVEARGARVETADIRERGDLERVVAERPDRVYLLAAQASRPVSERDPRYTEETNVSGTRLVGDVVGEAGVPLLVFGSSLVVYGGGLSGDVGPDSPYGPQRDLAHLSKIYGEQALEIAARRHGFAVAIMRLGVVYGPSPVEHAAEESQTVVDKFRRLAAAGQPLPVDDGGRATIGVVHVDDVARILLDATAGVENVAAETVTVADVAALARGEDPVGGAAFTVRTPFSYDHSVAEYLRP